MVRVHSCFHPAGLSRLAWGIKVRDVLKLLHKGGWFLVRVRGSQARYEHPVKAGRVTVPGRGSDDLAPKTLRSILRQAELEHPFHLEDQ